MVGHVGTHGQRDSVGKPQRKRYLKDTGIDGRIILKCFSNIWDGRTWN